PTARAIPIHTAATILGISRVVSGVCRARWHLAVAHMGADRSRGSADRWFDVARRHRHETGRLRWIASGDESFSARLPNVEQMDRRSCGNWNCLCGCGGAAPARPEIYHRLFEPQPHGFRVARASHSERPWRFWSGPANVFAQCDWRTAFRCGWTHGLSTHAHTRPRRPL